MSFFATLALLLISIGSPQSARAQALVVTTCGTLPKAYVAGSNQPLTQDVNGNACTNASGGGGGGLSIVDGAAFTAGTSPFTPSGGEYNSSPTALTSGDQGMLALNPYRAAFVDTMTTNSNLYSALTAPPNWAYSATYGGCSYSSGNNPACGDAKGALWVDVGALPTNATPTDCSVALTAGATAQNIIAATSTLHGFTIANIDASAGSGEPVWISFTTTAAASTIGSYPLAAPTATTFVGLNSYTTPTGFASNHAVSVIAGTTGHKISCTYW
jgi:hypothetical protein